MTIDEIRNVLVVGAGTMGRQIALRFALGGYGITLVDQTDDLLSAAHDGQVERARTLVNSGILDEGLVEPAFERMRRSTDLGAAAAGSDFVVDAIYENLQAKRDLFAQLDQICPSHTILATTSSSIRSSLIDDATTRPEKVLNTHFFRWEKPMVEIMRGSRTSDETVDIATALVRRIGLVPLMVRRESTGFMFNRVWRAIKRESLAVVDGDYASFEDVDRAFMMMFGYYTGPFGLMDEIGLDVILAIEKQYFAESGDERDRPPRILEEKVARGELGVKTGKGFYNYPDPAYKRPGWLQGDAG